jgi:3'(2'), 5'-bisphosphate nucleotidase
MMIFVDGITINREELFQALLTANELARFHFDAVIPLTTTFKSDHSPVTQVDYAISNLLKHKLNAINPNIPVISEEDDLVQSEATMRSNELFWLIDPIDGTRSFIKKRGHFVINVALIHRGTAIVGAIGAPLEREIYFGDIRTKQCFKQTAAGDVSMLSGTVLVPQSYDVLVSSNNCDKATADFIAKHPVSSIKAISSAYKYALMAEGRGHLHLRFGKTCIWDTAAGHAILTTLGGGIYDLSGKEIRYDQQIENPHFIALSNQDITINF